MGVHVLGTLVILGYEEIVLEELTLRYYDYKQDMCNAYILPKWEDRRHNKRVSLIHSLATRRKKKTEGYKLDEKN
jgi:hypothetical protein